MRLKPVAFNEARALCAGNLFELAYRFVPEFEPSMRPALYARETSTTLTGN